MRLVLNARFFNRPVTGVERLAIELSRSLRVLLAQRGESDLEAVVSTGTPVAENIGQLGDLPPTVHVVGQFHGHVWEQTELARAMPDAWLLNLCNTGPALRRRQVLIIHDAQFILHPESYSRTFRWWYRLMLTVASHRAAVVFTVSHFSRTQLEKFYVVPRRKLRVLRSGIDHLDAVIPDKSVLERRNLLARPYLLTIGSLAPHKNLKMLIDAFTRAELSETDLVIAGGGNPRVFRDAGLREAANIHFLGRVSDAELKALYGGAHAFACPSLSEGFGLTPLEAMRMGCPVIATTGGAVPEVCGDAALYADPSDRAAWSNGLRRIVEDRTLRAHLAAKASERASMFTWEEAARQLLDAIVEQEKADARAR
jgi:glycosyltransferase involved in cell wall biosynthesis